MTRITRRTALAGLGAGASTLALSAPALAQGPLNVGFIYVGPVADAGWSTQHDIGRRRAEELLGDRIRTHFVQAVPPPDMERVATQLARAQNCRLIFTTSFSYMEPTLRVARTLPEVRFESCTGIRRADNVAIYNLRAYEARYVHGVIAARKSRSGTIGYVASFPVPEVIHAINAIMRGAATVRPDLKMRVVWINSWFNPGREAEAARALMDQGCDVLFQHTDSPAPLQAAGERGVFAFGNNSDMTTFAPRSHLSSIVNIWGDYYAERCRAMLENRWTNSDTWGGLGTGMVRSAAFTNMSEAEIAEANAVTQRIASGALHPFAGPIVRQDGTEVIPAGQNLSDDAIRSMNYFLRGMDTQMPS